MPLYGKLSSQPNPVMLAQDIDQPSDADRRADLWWRDGRFPPRRILGLLCELYDSRAFLWRMPSLSSLGGSRLQQFVNLMADGFSVHLVGERA